jgi:hypothetical protein
MECCAPLPSMASQRDLERALVEAAQNGHDDCVRRLMDRVSDIDCGVHTLPDGSPFFSYQRWMAGVRDSVVVRNQTPLMQATTPEVAETLVRAGATGGLAPGVLALLRKAVFATQVRFNLNSNRISKISNRSMLPPTTAKVLSCP